MRVFHLFQLIPNAEAQVRLDTGDAALRSAVMRARFGQIDEAIGAGLYQYAASLNARNEDDVFYKTRSLDGAAWVEGGRILHAAENARETEIGDIVIDLSVCDAWMCASFGWEALSWDRCAHFLGVAQEMDLALAAPLRTEAPLDGPQQLVVAGPTP